MTTWVVLEKIFNQAFITTIAVIAFLCVYQSSRVIKSSFLFTISALLLLSSSRYWQKTHGLRLLLCIWLARKFRSHFSRLCKQTRMPHTSQLLSWSFHLLAVCNLASFLTKTRSLRKSRKTLSSACIIVYERHFVLYLFWQHCSCWPIQQPLRSHSGLCLSSSSFLWKPYKQL